MYQAYRFSFRQSLWWTRHSIFFVGVYSLSVCSLVHFVKWKWFSLPWQPVGLIGVALAFYLGFKNNSAYDRLWEARKIWGGIVNASRSFAVMARDFVHAGDEIPVMKAAAYSLRIYFASFWLQQKIVVDNAADSRLHSGDRFL